MIKFTFKGHKISIRNDDWKGLKERFNPDNVTILDAYNRVIFKSCSLCQRYEDDCTQCPIHVTKTSVKCTEIFSTFFRQVKFTIGFSRISWDREDDSSVRRQLKAILRRMEKIEASQ